MFLMHRNDFASISTSEPTGRSALFAWCAEASNATVDNSTAATHVTSHLLIAFMRFLLQIEILRSSRMTYGSGSSPRSWRRSSSAWIILRIPVFEAQRTDCRHLGDVLPRFGPMEVEGIAGQGEDAAGRQ